MSGSLGELVISISADIARFREDMGKAVKVAEAQAKQIIGQFDKINDAARRMGGIIAGIGGAASLGALIKSTIDAADDFSKMSQKVGVGIEQLTGMAHAAELSDVPVEELAKSMGKLNKAMYEAAGDGKSNPAKTFKELGVEVVDANGKLRSADEMMISLADKFANMDDGAKKTALAMEIFGKSGANMIPLLNSGSEGLREVTEEARRFGLVIGEDAGKRAEEFNDNLTRLKAQVRGLAMAVGNELVPEINSMFDTMAKGGDIENSAFIKDIRTIKSDLKELVDEVNSGQYVDAFLLLGRLMNPASISPWGRAETPMEIQKRIWEEYNGKLIDPQMIRAQYDKINNVPPKKGGNDAPPKSTSKPKEVPGARDQMRGFFNSVWDENEAELAAERFGVVFGSSLHKIMGETSDPSLLGKFSLFTDNEAEKAAKEKAAQLEEEIRKQRDFMQREMEAIEAVWAIYDPAKGFKKGLAGYVDYSKQLGASMQEVVGKSMKGMEDSLLDFVHTGKLNFTDLADSIIDDLARIAIQQTITGPLAAGIGSAMGSAFASSWTPDISWLLDGARADGGPVTAGKSYLVGERGEAEIFTPGASGYITPLSKTGGDSVSISVPLTVYGSKRFASDLRGEMEEAAERVIRRHS